MITFECMKSLNRLVFWKQRTLEGKVILQAQANEFDESRLVMHISNVVSTYGKFCFYSVQSLKEHQEVPGMGHTRSFTMNGLNTSSDFAEWNERRSNGVDSEVIQWSVLQFNNGSATPFVIKCGATSNLELVVKAQAKMHEVNGKEIVAVVPIPAALVGLSVDEIRQAIFHLPESFCQLAMARSADGTRARYTRLYKTLAIRVPSLKHAVEDLEESVSK